MNISQQQVNDFFTSSPYFTRLDEGERQRLVREFDLISLTPGQVLYHQGSRAEAFYLVFQGRISLTRLKHKRLVSEIQVGKGDSLGHESLLRNEPCTETAKAVDEVILLRMRGETLNGIIDRYPRIAESRNLLAGTQSLGRTTNLDWLNRDERIGMISRRHPYFLVLRTFIPGLLILLGVLLLLLNLEGITRLPQSALIGLAITAALGLLWIFWVGLDWSNDYYILTSKRLVRMDRKVGVFDQREEVPLGSVMSVDVTTTPLGKMFSFADVASRTYNTPVIWHGIPNPDLVARLIEKAVDRAKSGHAELEMGAMQAAIGRQLSGEDSQDGEPGPGPETTGSLPSPSITFRKHWVILFRKTWLPSVGLVISLFLLLGGLSNSIAVGSDTIKGLATAGMVSFLAWYLYQYLDWRNDTYQITADQIMDVKRTPLGREDRKTALLENIQSINYRRRGLFGLMLNYGTVNILVGTEDLVFDYVRDPSGVQREIFRRIAERQAALRQANIDSERERMSQWIAAYHRKVNE